MLHLIGTRSNRDAIGAQIHLVSESGLEQYAKASCAGSYLSASDVPVHFGLGRDRQARRLEIQWPSGTLQTLEQVRANQVITVIEEKIRSKNTRIQLEQIGHHESCVVTKMRPYAIAKPPKWVHPGIALPLE